MGLFGLFSKKEPKTKESEKDKAFRIAGNVFKSTLLSGEVLSHAIQGKCAAEKLIFSVGVFGATNKRLLYYFQDGSKTKVEILLYKNIISIGSTTGYEAKMGNYIGVEVELAHGEKRVVRCLDNEENKVLINELVFHVENMR